MYKQCNFFYIVGADELNSYIKFFFFRWEEEGEKEEESEICRRCGGAKWE